MAFRKPASKRVGLKVLAYGLQGSGKTLFGLSFPKVLAIDSENGISLYEGTEDSKNLVGVSNTQSFQDLEDTLYDAEEYIKDFGAETILVDSESKVYQNVQETIMIVEEKRAKLAGRDVMDTNLSVRSWGKIGQISTKLQNMKIDVTSKGVHFVSIAQAAEIKEKQGDSFVVTGHKPTMDKKAEFDYDIVLYFYREKQANGSFKFFARVEKDRSKVFKSGDIIENADYSLWAQRVGGMEGKETLDTNFAEKMEETQNKYEEQVIEEEKSLKDRITDLIKGADTETKTGIQEALKKAKIASFEGLTAKQQEKLEGIYQDFK